MLYTYTCIHLYTHMWRSSCDDSCRIMWQMSISGSPLATLSCLTATSGLSNMRCGTLHFPKPWMLDSLLKIIWKHFSTICLQLDLYIFFSSRLFLIADSTGINFLRYVKTLENSTTGSHFRYFGFILVDLTGLYSHQTCISDNDLSHSLFQHLQSRNWNNNLWH